MAMPHRVPHIMKKHKSNKSPASMLFFDTETRDKPNWKQRGISRQVLNFGYAYWTRYKDGEKCKEKWCRFEDTDTFYEFLYSCTEKEVPLYCFAHNLGFDLTILDFWLWSDRADFRVDYFVESDPPTFVVGKLRGRKIVFIDTLNYWRRSLEDIGKSIGVRKMKRPTKRSSAEYWDRYAKQDVVVLEAAVSNLFDYLKQNDLGQFGLSAASLAMSTFKHRFMSHDIFVHDNRHAMECERAAYFGGLTDCFFIGEVSDRTLYKLDVNSMYPYCMLNTFPTKLVDYALDPDPWDVYKRMDDLGAIAKVSVDCTKRHYPIRYNGRLCYARGKFETHLTGPELYYALNNGDVERVHSVNYYQLEPIFTEYVNFFWAERQRYKQEGNDTAQHFVKIFMNSLYGKFGQLGYDSQLLTVDRLEQIYAEHGKECPECYGSLEPLLNSVLSETNWQPLGLGSTLTIRRINNHVRVKVPNGEHSESFPGIAAYVTAYARVYLWELIRATGPRHCYYVDTDSLIVDRDGLASLERKHHLDKFALGKLKLESNSTYSCFHAPKDYCFAGIEVRKGIRPKAKPLGPNTFEQLQFEGIKSILRRGAGAYIDIKTITKTVTRKYNKGHTTASGWVEPFTLPEIPSEIQGRLF